MSELLPLDAAATGAGSVWFGVDGELRNFDDALFRKFVDEMPELVICFEPSGIVLHANESWLAAHRVTLGEVVGTPYFDHVHPDDRESTLDRHDRLARLTAGSRVMREEFAATGIGWLAVTYKAWFGPSGEYLAITAVARDQTEKREAELAMEIANRRLADSNRDLQDFAYVASHDLREPLRKIVAFGDRLASRYGDQLDERGLDYLDRIVAAGGRMQDLIDDLLVYSRSATEGEPRRLVHLGSVVVEVLSDLEIAIAEADAAVNLGPLPSVVADASQMRQLFQNLIGNAVKFRAPGRAPVVAVHAEPAPRPGSEHRSEEMGWRIQVVDNGIGFDEKYLPKIFTVFQRLHGRADYQGSGIGLSVCRRIVDRHHGELVASSAPGVGATFTVWLPAPEPVINDLDQ